MSVVTRKTFVFTHLSHTLSPPSLFYKASDCPQYFKITTQQNILCFKGWIDCEVQETATIKFTNLTFM
jgi:hypothetical protein